MGIELNVTVSDTRRQKPEYQIRGVVDVPGHPQSDEERDFLANLLFHRARIPETEKRGFQLVSWFATDGGTGVKIRHCRLIPVLTDKEIIGPITVYRSPEIDELHEEDPIGDEKYNEWRREYQSNRYCRFESREELNQRLQDIQVNTTILTPSGKMGLTKDEIWFRLGQHVIDEMLMRGQPPYERNLDPCVEIAQPFKDGNLCRKAAEIVSARGTDHDVVVKYGKHDHMKDLYERGIVWMNPATEYGKSSHNQAVHDDERVFVFKGGCYPSGRATRKFYNQDTVPDNIEELVYSGKAGFLTIFEAPGLKREEYVDVTVKMRTNYWTYCMAGLLEQRLFADFESDACVIIRKRPFVERLTEKTRLALPNVAMSFGEVVYQDPLGAFSTNSGPPKVSSIQIQMAKLFRYAYQNEIRFVCVPGKFQEDLEPKTIELGSISDIAEFVDL